MLVQWALEFSPRPLEQHVKFYFKLFLHNYNTFNVLFGWQILFKKHISFSYEVSFFGVKGHFSFKREANSDVCDCR